MAQLTPSRRSALLQQLLAQMSQTPQGTRTGGEALVRLGTKFLQKMQYDKLREEEMGDNQAVADAIMQGMFKNDYVPKGAPNADGTIDEITVTPKQRSKTLTPGGIDPVVPTVKEPGVKAGRVQREQPNVNAVISALVGRPELLNQVLPTLGAITQLQPKPKEVEWDLKEIKSGDQYETWITRNNIPVEKFSTADRMQKVMQGTPEDFMGTDSQIGKHKLDFGQRVAAINSWGKTASGFVADLRKTPGANTVVASMANMANKLWQEAKALKANGVYEFDEDFRGTDIGLWEDVFSANGLAGASAKAKRGFLSLAITGAAAMGLGTGRALSDRDVEQQLQTLGANQSDPEIIASIFSDSYDTMLNMAQAEKDQFEHLKGFTFEEYDFGGSPKIREWDPATGTWKD